MKEYLLNPPYTHITLLSVSFMQLLILKMLFLLSFKYVLFSYLKMFFFLQ